MNRKVFFNDVPNVTMYATEGGTNNNNCAIGCGGCNEGDDGESDNTTVIASVIAAGATVVSAGLTAAATIIAGADDEVII